MEKTHLEQDELNTQKSASEFNIQNNEQGLGDKSMLCELQKLTSQILNTIYSQKEYREQKLKKIQRQDDSKKFLSFGLIDEDLISIDDIKFQLQEIYLNLAQLLNLKNSRIKQKQIIQTQKSLSLSKIVDQNRNQRRLSSPSETAYQQKNQDNFQGSLSEIFKKKLDSFSTSSTLNSLGKLCIIQEEENQNIEQYQQIDQQSETGYDLDFLKIQTDFLKILNKTNNQVKSSVFSDSILKISRSKKSEECYIYVDSSHIYVFQNLDNLYQNKNFPVWQISKIILYFQDQCEIQIKSEYSLKIIIQRRKLFINHILSVFSKIDHVEPPQILISDANTQK